MNLKDIIVLARKAISSNRLRTNLTVAIIAIGITALVCIITAIECLKSSIYSNFTSMGSNTFTIANTDFFVSRKKHTDKKRLKTNTEQSRITLPQAQLFKELYTFPSTISQNIFITNTATIKHNDKKSNPTSWIMGVDEYYLSVSQTNLTAGHNFTNHDIQGTDNTCIIGNNIAQKYFADEQDAVDNILSVGDINYRVIGVMESKGSSMINRMDNMVLITINNARKNYAIQNKSYVLSIKINDIKRMDFALSEAEGIMRTVRKVPVGYENNFSVTKNDELANMLLENIKNIALAASIIGLITLLGAAIGLMNIMLVSVAERTREIGLTKAIGANSSIIKKQFLTESILISLKGGVIGILVGILLGNVVSLLAKTTFVIPWIWIMISITICFIVGIAAGIYPAIKAGKLNPINALRYE